MKVSFGDNYITSANTGNFICMYEPVREDICIMETSKFVLFIKYNIGGVKSSD
jgi:hypothetical protein